MVQAEKDYSNRQTFTSGETAAMLTNLTGYICGMSDKPLCAAKEPLITDASGQKKLVFDLPKDTDEWGAIEKRLRRKLSGWIRSEKVGIKDDKPVLTVDVTSLLSHPKELQRVSEEIGRIEARRWCMGTAVSVVSGIVASLGVMSIADSVFKESMSESDKEWAKILKDPKYQEKARRETHDAEVEQTVGVGMTAGGLAGVAAVYLSESAHAGKQITGDEWKRVYKGIENTLQKEPPSQAVSARSI